MVKLKDAKCPNCGANIEVNDALEKTICQYCGSTVIIEEAIEKYKVELSGKVEVEGIKGRNDKLTQAKKHMSLAEYDVAKKILLEIIADDQFDTEAYIELVKVDIELLEKMNFDPTTSKFRDSKGWNLLEEVDKNYERIKKIDDNNIAEGLLSDYKEKLDHYCNMIEEAKNQDKKLAEYVEILNGHLEKLLKISDECAGAWINGICGKYFDMIGLYTNYEANAMNGSNFTDRYKLRKFTKITRDGIVEGEYRKVSNNYTTNPLKENLHLTNPNKILTFDQIGESIKEIDEMTPTYIAESTNIRNKEIDKANGKLERENAYADVKNTLKYIWIGFLCLWVLGFVIATIMTLINNFVAGIAMIIFLDSWLVIIPIGLIRDAKDYIDYNKKLKETNKLLKQDKV